VNKVETALAEVNMIGIDTKQSIVSVEIMEKITEKRPNLMECLLGDMHTLSDPNMLLDKLCKLANHEQVQQLAEVAVKPTMALVTSSSNHSLGPSNNKSKRKRIIKHPCALGYHNPESTTHSENKCWFLNPPKKKEPEKEQQKSVLNYPTTTTAGEEVTEDYAYVTGPNAQKDAIILDSGASQHIFNSMSFFLNAKPTMVYIVTGTGAKTAEMTAMHKGTARIQIGRLTITLCDALYVPRLSTNLLSFEQLVKETVSLTQINNRMILNLNSNHSIQLKTSNNIFEIENASAVCQTALVAVSNPEISDLQKWHV
jgi:hypothetical protein